MIPPRWRKVLRDLSSNKTRTILVVLSIAIGVFAIGMIVGTQVMLDKDLSESYTAINPGSAILVPDGFDEDLLYTIERMPEVQQVEGRRSVNVRLQVGPDTWKDLELNVIPNYEDMRLNKIAFESGQWPPPYKGILLERMSLNVADTFVGDTLTVEDANGKIRQLDVAGLVHDINRPPVQFTGIPAGFITLDTLDWLGFSRQFDQLHILVSGDTLDKGHIQTVADLVEAKVEKSGRTVYFTWIPEPGEHPANESVQPMLLILGVLGALSLFASSFLVINIINGLLAQHTQQIGIMKAIGARRSQIMMMYLVAVILFSLLSLLIAVPLGGLAAYALSDYMASLINFDLETFRIPGQALAVMIGVGLLVPLLAAAYPIARGVAITVREAISDYGLGKGQFGSSPLDRFVTWITSRILSLPRPEQISLRNAIRRKARLLFTLVTLILGGAIFISILSVHASLLATLDDILAYFNYDVQVDFDKSQRIDEIQRQVVQVPGVAEAGSWVGNTGRRQRDNGTEGPNIFLIGTEAETNLIQPVLLDGRWLLPEDTNAIVLNSLIIQDEEDVKVGDTITVKVEAKDREFRVVGIVQGVGTGPIAYINRSYFARMLGVVGRSGSVLVIGEQHTPAFQADLARRLQAHFDSVGLEVDSTEATYEIRENVEFQFNIIVVFLSVMAILIAAVGGLGLMGTMSINVLERTREIGVMRAVGASDNAILRVVLVEGLFVGFISWLFGAAASYPIGRVLSNMVGIAFMQSPLSYRFAINGMFVWLAAVLVIAVLASYLPARNASRLSVRETLAYE